MRGEEKYSYVDEAGRTVHVFDDGFGSESKVIEYNMFDHIFTGEQWCPQCLRQMEKKAGYFECPLCGFTVYDSDIDENGGIPSLGAALDYRDEYDMNPRF